MIHISIKLQWKVRHYSQTKYCKNNLKVLKNEIDRSQIALYLHYTNITYMCYVYIHSHFMITFILNKCSFFYHLQFYLCTYLCSREYHHFLSFLKLSSKISASNPLFSLKPYIVAPYETFLCEYMFTGWVTHFQFSVPKNQIIHTIMFFIPDNLHYPYFIYNSIICLDFIMLLTSSSNAQSKY